MKLADVKRLAVKRAWNIRFSLPNGLECVIDCHGLARVPGLNGPPDFSLEEGFAAAQYLAVEQGPDPGDRAGARVKRHWFSRSQLEEWVSPAEGAGLSAEE
jgi:hypothetical protein